jgi:type II secretory pathway pseudopilin PulG
MAPQAQGASMKKEQGFSITELLMALLISVGLLSAALGSFNDAVGINEKANLMADLEQNLRSGINFLVSDLMNAGWEIPTGGIPIPSGAGAVAVNRPSPPGSFYTFAGSLTISAVNTGENLGPVGNGRQTDMVSILFADNLLPLNQTPLSAIGANGSSMTVNAGTPISGVPNALQAGDLIAFSNGLGNTLQYVTRVDQQIAYFNTGDPLNLNQPAIDQGSIKPLKDPNTGVFPPTTATRVWLVTYYIDTITDPTMPRLIRRINNRPGQTVALIIDDLKLTYDLVDGANNPAGVATPVAPNSPNQIRSANIYMSGRSSARIKNSNDFLRRNLTTQVSLRSLSFVDRYN